MDRDIEQTGDYGETYREHRDTVAAAGQVPTCPMCGRTSHGFACDGLVTEDAKRQAAAAGQVSAVHPWNTMSLNQSQEAAAGQVPTEAVEAAVETYGRMALQDGIDWTDCLKAALAAAAPLIVAAQQDVEECDHCGEEKRVAWWYENYEVAICGDCHEEELLERDNLRAGLAQLSTEHAKALAEVARLTAKRDAAAESIQARDRIIAALQAKILGDFPGGPR